jgi:hypothetical protein
MHIFLGKNLIGMNKCSGSYSPSSGIRLWNKSKIFFDVLFPVSCIIEMALLHVVHAIVIFLQWIFGSKCNASWNGYFVSHFRISLQFVENREKFIISGMGQEWNVFNATEMDVVMLAFLSDNGCCVCSSFWHFFPMDIVSVIHFGISFWQWILCV